jgi:hypothetical protein
VTPRNADYSIIPSIAISFSSWKKIEVAPGALAKKNHLGSLPQQMIKIWLRKFFRIKPNSTRSLIPGAEASGQLMPQIMLAVFRISHLLLFD